MAKKNRTCKVVACQGIVTDLDYSVCPKHVKKPDGKEVPADNIENHSGSKYIRTIQCCVEPGRFCLADVYAVLKAFNVHCPATQHALKKLLCAGIRGKGDKAQDLKEARDALSRAIQLANN